LFRHRLFRAAITGGTLFRIGIGAMPLLLPLMLQLGFGFDPFQSGLITFAGALGAMTSKFVAERVFAALGFKRVFIGTAIASAMLLAANGFFFPETPVALIIAVLLLGGVVRSMFFTGINALAYADIG